MPAQPGINDVLVVAATAEAAVGDTISVTLANRSGQAVRGELAFDNSRLAATSGAAGSGRMAFNAAARGDAVVVLRVLPAAAGGQVPINVEALQGAAGEPLALRVEGLAVVRVRSASEVPR